ncbi:YbhB/YbcL family Raf kinase inhibitor-like protein [Vandammella animalimorsus]|uniref:YbhB/YbcL family Raf kinase inhibitor-like protein n=1 Tax=Vandammella animalimorsus TaxID=2029117 RepID=UPI00325C1FF0
MIALSFSCKRLIAGAALLSCASVHAQLEVTSPAFAAGTVIPDPFTYNLPGQCNGSNWSPPLEITGIPAGTQRLAIEMRDQTFPWLHWKVWDIPVQAAQSSLTLPHDAASNYNSSSAQNEFGTPGYGGPCPPTNAEHTYVFKVYALTTAVGSGEPSSSDLAAVPANQQASLQGKRARNSSQPWTPPSLPGMPQNLQAAPGDGQVVLSWAVPITGHPSSYTYTVSVDGAAYPGCTGITVRTCTVTGLINGTAYDFAVTASNTAGEGPAATRNGVQPGQAAATPAGATPVPTLGQWSVLLLGLALASLSASWLRRRPH